MSTSKVRKLWKNEYFQTVVVILVMVIVVFGLWQVSRLVLNTDYPALTVASGSMCTLPGRDCDGWSHPFDRTLHVGDLIIVQGVKAEDIHAAPYPDGDIIIYRPVGGDSLIVHRAIEKINDTDTLYIVAKGDGNPGADQPVPADRIVGKVIMRVPWVGHLTLRMQSSAGILIVVALIFLILIIEFIIPASTSKKPKSEAKDSSEEHSG